MTRSERLMLKNLSLGGAKTPAGDQQATIASPESIKHNLSLCILKKIHEHHDIDDDAFREIIADVISEETSCVRMTLEDKRLLLQVWTGTPSRSADPSEQLSH